MAWGWNGFIFLHIWIYVSDVIIYVLKELNLSLFGAVTRTYNFRAVQLKLDLKINQKYNHVQTKTFYYVQYPFFLVCFLQLVLHSLVCMHTYMFTNRILCLMSVYNQSEEVHVLPNCKSLWMDCETVFRFEIIFYLNVQLIHYW